MVVARFIRGLARKSKASEGYLELAEVARIICATLEATRRVCASSAGLRCPPATSIELCHAAEKTAVLSTSVTRSTCLNKSRHARCTTGRT